MKRNKCHFLIFYNLFDIIIIPFWLLYRRVREQKQMSTPLKLKDFRLSMCGSSIKKKRGWPSSACDIQIDMKKKKAFLEIFLPHDVWRDGFEYFTLWNLKFQYCKFPGYKEKAFIICEKCQIGLCLIKDNCLQAFHECMKLC